MAYDFGDIREKIRKLTGRLSSDQMSDNELNNYINNYIHYTFPAEFKLDTNLVPYKFLTVKDQEYYPLPENFTNFVPPVYINGLDFPYYTNPGWSTGFGLNYYLTPSLYYRSIGQYYYRTRLYPRLENSGITAFTNANPGVITVLDGSLFTIGDVISVTGVIENAVGTDSLNGSYTIASIAGNDLTLTTDTSGYHTYVSSGLATTTSTDVYGQATQNYRILAGSVIVTDNVETFTDDGNGVLTGSLGGTGNVNYQTGAINVTFNTNPTTDVWLSYLTYQSGQPQIILNYNGNFRLYPVPDNVYQIELAGYQMPDVLVNAGDTPKLQEWGPVIAYGAARDIFADYGEMDRYGEMTALYKEQVKYVNRRDIQNTMYRSAIRSS